MPQPDSLTRNFYAAKAMELWQQLSASERTGVRFGMFPADKMAQFEQTVQAELREPFNHTQAAVALMECASRDGGMRA